jgi:hypothetical protein
MYSISMPIDRYGLGSPGGPGAMVITPVRANKSYTSIGHVSLLFIFMLCEIFGRIYFSDIIVYLFTVGHKGWFLF